MIEKYNKLTEGIKTKSHSATLKIFHREEYKKHGIEKFLNEFCDLDDYDFLNAIKHWTNHPDNILSFLCKGIINRNLLKVKYFSRPVPGELLERKKTEAIQKLNITGEEATYLTFKGETKNKT